jgi:transposase
MSLFAKIKMSPLGGREMETITMSSKEISRLEVMQKLGEKRMSQKEAGVILGVSERHIKRLLKAYRQKGAAGLISKHRGRKGNHCLPAETKQKALDLLKSKYKGFGPTLAHEKLVEKENLKLSDESVRQLMIEESLWKPRKVKKVVVHPLRERRACVGELVQIDGSPHAWFEDRAEACVLLVFIDDATGKLLQLRFVESESFFSYCVVAEGYFKQHGKPVAFYSDKHGIFRVNTPSVGQGDSLTQFGRAMQELDIQIICANTPQAKGRVERVNQTLQDRLVKEMRLRGISSMADGNVYLPEFIADFNPRFAVEPRSSVNAHRPLTAKDDLATILSWQEQRVVSKNLTVQFEKVVYQIQTQRPSYALRNAHVTVCVTAQQQLTIRYKGVSLPYTIYHRQVKQAEVVSSKDLNAILQERTHAKPAPNHPWRTQPLFPSQKKVEMSPSRGTGTFLLWRMGDISILG